MNGIHSGNGNDISKNELERFIRTECRRTKREGNVEGKGNIGEEIFCRGNDSGGTERGNGEQESGR